MNSQKKKTKKTIHYNSRPTKSTFSSANVLIIIDTSITECRNIRLSKPTFDGHFVEVVPKHISDHRSAMFANRHRQRHQSESGQLISETIPIQNVSDQYHQTSKYDHIV